jgi:oligopeptidase A
MLGYRHFADVSLVPKMADTPEQVLGFLRDLAAKAKPFAERDLAELQAFAKDELGLAPSNPGTWPTSPRSCGSPATPSPSRR